MGLILNAKGQLAQWKKMFKDAFFVDKTEILSILNERIGTIHCYVCITRPRRFGKTVMTNMISSYYGKEMQSKEIFDKLKISKCKSYEEYRNQYNVISLNLSEMPEECKNYSDYINYHSERIKNDLMKAFPESDIKPEESVWDQFEEIYNETGEGFVFILDEWDCIFHSDIFTEGNRKQYLAFLRNLLKDRPYVELAYMTGILPIKQYSSGSEMNMFEEFYFPMDNVFDKFFGFTEEEVEELCDRNMRKGGTITYDCLAEWYNGYYTYTGMRLYNPRSVNKALNRNKIQNYWTETGPGTEILDLVRKNVSEVRDDIVRMVAGEKIKFLEMDFTTNIGNIGNKDEIYSTMVIYGFLSYYDNLLSIPNMEIMQKFQKVLQNQSMGYIAQLTKNSEVMLQATLENDIEKMVTILEYTHNTEIPVLQYNDENSLSCVVTLIYLSARDRYRIEREDKSGKGYVDFIFYPINCGDPAIILELKKDKSPTEAIEQIRKKQYDTKLKVMKNGVPVHTGEVLLVGINYDTRTKTHSCLIEKI